MSKLGAIAAAIAIVAWSSTATAGPRAVTLAEALAAIPEAPAHRVAHSQIAAAAGEADAAGAWPSTSLGVATAHRTERLGLVASLPLPVFGTLSANRRVARADLEVVRAQARTVDDDLRREVTRAWVALAQAEAAAELADRAQARQEQLAVIAKARFDAGDAPRVDVVTAGAGAARARAEAAAARAAIAGASADLAAALGWDPTARLSAAGGLSAPGEVPSLADLRRARSGHPRVRVAAAEVDAQAARVGEAGAARWPSLSLDLESLFHDPTLPGNDYRIGLTLSLPIFGKTGAARAAAVSRRHTAELQRSLAVDAVDAAIVAAYGRYRAAAELARQLDREVLPARNQAAELARAAYREGQEGLVTVVEAERALAEAEAEVVDARARAAEARAELAWAVGGAL